MALEFLAVILLSMIPVFELRGAIPYGIAFSNLNFVSVFLISVAANIMVIPIVFFFLDFVHHRLVHIRVYEILFNTFLDRAKRKSHKHISKYGYLGLTLFVAIPLPITGAYTGTLAAWLFGMDRKKSMAALAAGVIMAGIIVTILVVSGAGIFNIFLNTRLSN